MARVLWYYILHYVSRIIFFSLFINIQNWDRGPSEHMDQYGCQTNKVLNRINSLYLTLSFHRRWKIEVLHFIYVFIIIILPNFNMKKTKILRRIPMEKYFLYKIIISRKVVFSNFYFPMVFLFFWNEQIQWCW